MGATELALCVMDLDGHRGMSLHYFCAFELAVASCTPLVARLTNS